MKFAVLNPGGRDPLRLFSNGAGNPSDAGHPPINYHAYAACTHGGFFDSAKAIPETVTTVLVLLRKDLKIVLRDIAFLQQKGKRCYISWKESGSHQVASMLDDAKRLERFFEVCTKADGFLSSTRGLVSLYRLAGCKSGDFIPTPYPVNQPAWDFSIRREDRKGIFIGTREFDVPSRNHLAAITAACALDYPVTCMQTGGGRERAVLKTLTDRFPNLTVHRGRLHYPDYLKLMARHRVVFQWDQSEVPGQVAGDAVLCRIPCVGGNSAIEEVVFPHVSTRIISREQTLEVLGKLMKDDDFYERSGQENSVCAKDISFECISDRLEKI